jgi:hypothetical protein
MVGGFHQYGKKPEGFAWAWLKMLLQRAGLLGLPQGATLGPIPYIDIKAGPYRKARRTSVAIWRRFGEAAAKIAKRRDIPIGKALEIAMGGR